MVFSLLLASAAAQLSSAQSNGILTTSSQSSRTQSTGQTSTPQAELTPALDDVLRGGWGPYRANNQLLYYHLDVRVHPDKKFLSGKNTIRFRMLKDGTRVQIDLNHRLDPEGYKRSKTLCLRAVDSLMSEVLTSQRGSNMDRMIGQALGRLPDWSKTRRHGGGLPGLRYSPRPVRSRQNPAR